MTTLILYVLLWLWDNRSFDSVSKTNELKVMAEDAFMAQRYKESAEIYHQIAYGTMFSSPSARMNLAHAYFKNGQYKLAEQQYKLLVNIRNRHLASVANGQIGVIRLMRSDSASALMSFRKALELHVDNKNAKSNYIFLKRHYHGSPDASERSAIQRKVVQKLKQQQAAPDSIPAQQQQLTAQTKREQLLKSLKSINMTEDQARSILDAMKTNESQYIFQLRRAQYAADKEGKKKIEW
ncbi:tetratricopeptide repeat protein [Dyadobacter tibetensis]|uniref:tetratricopeptide repeat protein n=1 Tax=Dyadobacter tibetensis TaxID=1211851 RepID=UPI00046F04A9|nr:tetratricopeptide repeat protein [Dyadobacter tibetensis]